MTSTQQSPAPSHAHDGEVIPLQPDAILPTAGLPELEPYSDGRMWESGVVLREILAETEKMVVSAHEIGRRLIWTKWVLDGGGFMQWCKDNLPFSAQTARKYMRIADFFTSHPKLLKPLAEAGVKRTLLLTTLPEDQIQEIVESSQVGEAPLDRLPSTPYVELKRQVDKLKADKDEQAEVIDKTERALTDARERIADLTGVLSTDDKKLVAELRKYRDQLDTKLTIISAQTAYMAQRFPELPAAVRAEYIALWEWMKARIDLAYLDSRVMAGQEVYQAEFVDVMSRARPMRDDYPLESRFALPFPGEDDREGEDPDDTNTRPGRPHLRPLAPVDDLYDQLPPELRPR